MSDRESARARIEKQAIENFEKRPQNTAVRKTGRITRPVHDPEPTREWFVIIPVKGTPDAKSRLVASTELALAIALDTVEAALAAPGVAQVLVVTSEAASVVFDDTDAFVVVEHEPGLAVAIATGLETAADFSEPGRGVAILLGDLPALRPAELGDALLAATAHDRAMVPDSEGTGTTLITAADGQTHDEHFGPGSAAAHRAAGYAALDVAADSGLRSDVDTPASLTALASRVGSRTAGHLTTITP
ncbi:2-phospho-L-lactate guanylyltransferase [soil metagenome]